MKQINIIGRGNSIKRKQQDFTVIGVGALRAGAGSTSTALLLAGYLSTYLNPEVVLLDHSGSGDLRKIAGRNKSADGKPFCKGFLIAPESAVSEPVYYRSTGCRYCVIDYGICWKTEAYRFQQCELKVLVGGGSVWQQEDWKSLVYWLDEKELNADGFRFLINRNDGQFGWLKKILSQKLYFLEYEPDPFHPSLAAVRLMKELTSCIV